MNRIAAVRPVQTLAKRPDRRVPSANYPQPHRRSHRISVQWAFRSTEWHGSQPKLATTRKRYENAVETVKNTNNASVYLQIIEHLISISELLDLGFDENKISDALLRFDNNKDKALDFLIS